MSNEAKEKLFKELFKDSTLFEVRSVNDINHRPHLYTIGPRHIAYASDHYGGMLDKEVYRKVPCAHPGCRMDYDSHTSDNVLFLSLKRNGTNDEANKEIKTIFNDEMNKKLVDGITFVETEEKFRIT